MFLSAATRAGRRVTQTHAGAEPSLFFFSPTSARHRPALTHVGGESRLNASLRCPFTLPPHSGNTREKLSRAGPPSAAPVRSRTVASATVLGLLIITFGEGFYRQQAGGRGGGAGCLCVLPDREGMLDRCWFSHSLPATLCHGCVQSEGNYIYLAAVSHSWQIGPVWSLTPLERLIKDALVFIKSRSLDFCFSSPFSQALKRLAGTPSWLSHHLFPQM